MQMDEGEITRKYKEAKNKNMQVEILADLNVCSKDYIIEILTKNGIEAKQLPRKRNNAPFQPLPGAKPKTTVVIPKRQVTAKEKARLMPVPMEIVRSLRRRAFDIESLIRGHDEIIINHNNEIRKLEDVQIELETERNNILNFLEKECRIVPDGKVEE